MTEGSVPRAARNVPALLLTLRQEGFSGLVTVSGSPGGTIHLERGLVTAIDSPGTPSAETLLLRSRRISEADWSAAATVGAADGRLDRALIAAGVVSAAELEIVCLAAAFDGAFAMSLSPPGSREVTASAAAPQLPVRPGLEPQLLFDETARRRALLTRLWGPPGELARTRFHCSPEAGGGALRMPRRYRDLLAAATGRNTPRDIGFGLGRGLFAVMLDLAGMDARRLLVPEAARSGDAAPSVAPRTPPTGAPAPVAGPLPRRTPGRPAPGARAATTLRATTLRGTRPITLPAVNTADEPPVAHRTEKSRP